MAPSTVYGDAEAAVAAILRADPGIDAEVGVSADLVGYDRADRWLRVTRTGGAPSPWLRQDNPIITVDAYAPTKAESYDLAAAALAAIYAARGYVSDSLKVYDITDTLAFTWETDENDVARYAFEVTLATRPV
jgi:hypothetical protein